MTDDVKLPRARVRLVLTREHTHAGRVFNAGDLINVEASIAEWLLAQGVALRWTESPPPVGVIPHAEAPPHESDPTSAKPHPRRESKQ